MIASTKDLYELVTNPRINDISLILLSEFYKEYLTPFCYHYKIVDHSGDKEKQFTIDLRFDTDRFCHLLGIESILGRSKSFEQLKQYKGVNGWDNVENGTITIPSLRTPATRGNFNINKDKYVFFYVLPKLVETPKGVLFDKEKVLGNPTNIECEILFYDQYQNATVHLGIMKDEKLGYYVPRTFFIARITPSKDGLRYVGNQQVITVNKIDKASL